MEGMTADSRPLDLLRTLKGAPYICLMALVYSGKVEKSTWLRSVTGYSSNTITDAMALLVRLGLVTHTGGSSSSLLTGWQLAPGVSHLMAGECSEDVQSATIVEPGLSNRDAHTPQSQPALSFSDSLPVEPMSPPSNNTIRSARATSIYASALVDSQSLKSVEGDDSRSPPDSDSDSQLSPSNRAPHGPVGAASIARILDATASLFGERVHGPPERYPDPHLLLAAIAEAHDHRTALRKPARVVYTNLRNGVSPASRYREDPLAYLPQGFLEQAGLPIPDRLSSYQGWTSTPDPPDDPLTLPEPLPTISQTVDPAVRYSAEQAWHYVRRLMLIDTPSVVYNQRIASLRLARYSPDPPLFVVAAPDEETRLWLQDRCTRLFTRHLSGICCTQAGVEFIVDQRE